MKVYYPALITGALFASLLIIDLIRRESKPFLGHLIFGVIAIVLMVYLSQNDADFVAWGLFSVPIIILITGLLIGYFNTAPGTTTVTTPVSPTLDACAPRCIPPACTPPRSCSPKDNSGNTVTPAPVVTPPTPVKACGPNSGKTQCVDTKSLQSA